MEETKQPSVEVKMENGEQVSPPAPPVEEPKAPEAPVEEKKETPTVAESELAAHREKLDGAREKEIQRRCEIDPQKPRAEIEKEYDEKMKQETQFGHTGAVASHQKGPGKPVDQH